MRTQIIGTIGAVVIIVIVLRLVVLRRLLVKYAALWLGVGVVLVVMAAIPDAPEHLARALGFVVPANLLFFSGFTVLLLVALQLSVELTRVEARVQRLAEELAILKAGQRSKDTEG